MFLVKFTKTLKSQNREERKKSAYSLFRFWTARFIIINFYHNSADDFCLPWSGIFDVALDTGLTLMRSDYDGMISSRGS